jgi:L-2-hydroxyglutarate oxidase
MAKRFDIIIVGGGIVGCSVARELSSLGKEVAVLEKEVVLGTHQTGHNSGVIHSGLYYKPGSMKARTCVEGHMLLERFCQEEGVPFERCGKLVLATSEDELPALDELERRGRANGLAGVRRLKPAEIREREPHASGVAALLVPETGIVDYRRVVKAFGALIERSGGVILTNVRVLNVRRIDGGITLETSREAIHGRCLVNCAGLHSDRVAAMSGRCSAERIVPFRGEYYELVPERRSLVKHLVYPVPDPEFPFLGVHFTRTIGGGVEAGPNAVLALKREGYAKSSFSFPDAWSTMTFGGFWRMARRHWRAGLNEVRRSWSKAAFVRSLQKLVPEIREEDLVASGAGVRAQVVDATGALVDDFRIDATTGMVHVLNAPSPAATASIAIGKLVASEVLAQLV